jgi:hypothetical protein
MNSLSSTATSLTQFSYRAEGTPRKQLSVQARSLDEFYAANQCLPAAQDVMDAMEYVAHLKTTDNAAGDLDRRRGHVVRPAENFEYHKDTQRFHGDYSRDGRAYRVEGDEQQVRARSTRPEGRPSTEQASFRPRSGQLQYRPSRPHSAPSYKEPVTGPLLEEATFPISRKGKIPRPQVQSLEDAAKTEAERSQASRAASLVRAGIYWFHQGPKLDGKEEDLNPAQGEVVAAGIDPYGYSTGFLGLGTYYADFVTDGNPPPPFGSGKEFEEGHYPLKDVEVSPDGFTVFGSHGKGEKDPLAPRLTGSTDGPITNLTFTFPRENFQENVVWNKESGTVTYQKFKTR